MKRFLFVVSIVSLTLLSGCSGFDKIMKSKDYEYKYQMALKYYEAKDHYHYLMLFESLQNIYRSTVRSDTVDFYICQGNYYQGDYELAGHYYDRFRRTFTRSPFTEEAEYMYAYCFYRSSPRPELDQSNTLLALSAFAEYTAKYPNSERNAKIKIMVKELRDKLMEKSYLNSKLYFDIGNYKSAIVALRNSVNQYPNSKYREEQMYLILRSSYLLATNSVPAKRRERLQNTIDEYYNFASEFPESKHMSAAKQMYKRTTNELKKYN